ncbi:hypothetical protein M948_03890 [Virgibacillus sp. CM-4]|nr:hypothetical protein M948_03890 [Virgibacillus sp. CM-4]
MVIIETVYPLPLIQLNEWEKLYLISEMIYLLKER